MGATAWSSVLVVLVMVAGAAALPLVRASPRGPVINTDSEPNDDFANATQVVPGPGNTIKIAGTADPNDPVDFYKIRLNFTAPDTAEKLNVTAHVDTNQAAVRVFIYDTNALNMVLDADANQYQDHTVETVASHTGDYFVWYECQVFQGTVGMKTLQNIEVFNVLTNGGPEMAQFPMAITHLGSAICS